MEPFRLKNIFVVLVASFFLFFGMFFVLEKDKIDLVEHGTASILNAQDSSIEAIELLLPALAQKLENPPEIIKAVYVTGYSASSKNYLNYLTNLFSSTEINAVIVDIKGSDGKTKIYDVDELVRFFHEKNIYVIGRIAVFEDPVFSKARPELAVLNALGWLDPASKEVWDYNISLAKDAFYHGFDEINFDYVRFPSDGNVSNMGFPVWDGVKLKQQVIKEFFQYLRSELFGEKISVDLFGQTTTNTDDMGIGQILEDAFGNFDFVSPMLYPSHYINGFIGYKNPAQYPYEVVKYSMDGAKNKKEIFANKDAEPEETPAKNLKMEMFEVKLAKFRPWLQDFNMGANYTAKMVKEEIKAVQDSLGTEYNGFMLWNSNNVYTKGAVVK